MTRNKAARSSCSYSRAIVHDAGDYKIITSDVLLGAAGVALIVGIPFIMAVLKQWGCW